MPADSVERYHHVRWETPVPSGPFEAVIQPTWVRGRGGRTEFELVIHAEVGGRAVASSRIVCLTQAMLPSAGSPIVAEAPDPHDLVAVRSMTVDDATVQEFCDASRTKYAVTTKIKEAQVLGFRNVLVPGPLLTIIHMADALSDRTGGSIGVWFKGPVTAGSAMLMCRSESEQAVWSLRSVGTGRPTTLALIEQPRL